MKRQIIEIDTNKCNGCGLCVKACHESALGLVNGKATLLRDDYCDGMGDCLPNCPMDAIHFIDKDTVPYDEASVLKNKELKSVGRVANELENWPVQIRLVQPDAIMFHNRSVLIAADCTAYAYANIHKDFIKDRICLIGCTKLDDYNYAEKLEQIFTNNLIKDVTILRMHVPCCGGMEVAVNRAVSNSGKDIPVKTVIISSNGEILDEH